MKEISALNVMSGIWSMWAQWYQDLLSTHSEHQWHQMYPASRIRMRGSHFPLASQVSKGLCGASCSKKNSCLRSLDSLGVSWLEKDSLRLCEKIWQKNSLKINTMALMVHSSFKPISNVSEQCELAQMP